MENHEIIPSADPFALFDEWYTFAAKHEPGYPDAATLATAGADGMPSARMVLVKSYGAKGFNFYTNRQSHKGEQLEKNRKAALCFYWKSVARQVRIEGLVTPLGDAESDAYFASRVRESRIGAWVSQQSRPLDSRAELERSFHEWEKKFEGQDVPRPLYWGGYRVTPLLIEFWQEASYRLHDRVVYRRSSEHDPWRYERIYP